MKYPIFNVYTGEFYEYLESELPNILEGEVPLLQAPKRNCKKCLGKGYTGRDVQKNTFPPCICVEQVLNTKFLPTIKYTALIRNKQQPKG